MTNLDHIKDDVVKNRLLQAFETKELELNRYMDSESVKDAFKFLASDSGVTLDTLTYNGDLTLNNDIECIFVKYFYVNGNLHLDNVHFVECAKLQVSGDLTVSVKNHTTLNCKRISVSDKFCVTSIDSNKSALISFSKQVETTIMCNYITFDNHVQCEDRYDIWCPQDLYDSGFVNTVDTKEVYCTEEHNNQDILTTCTQDCIKTFVAWGTLHIDGEVKFDKHLVVNGDLYIYPDAKLNLECLQVYGNIVVKGAGSLQDNETLSSIDKLYCSETLYCDSVCNMVFKGIKELNVTVLNLNSTASVRFENCDYIKITVLCSDVNTFNLENNRSISIDRVCSNMDFSTISGVDLDNITYKRLVGSLKPCGVIRRKHKPQYIV